MEKITQFVMETGYRGIFDIELGKLQDGQVYFIEMNCRNGAYGYAYTKAGGNLPWLWYQSCVGEEIENIKIKREIFLMNEFTDFRNVMEKKVSLFKWIRQLIGADVKLIFNWHDIGPFIYKIIYQNYRRIEKNG